MYADDWLIRKIISSGQTGVELAALDVAIEMGLTHGGWAPRGLRNEAGPLPDYLGMTEVDKVGFHEAMTQNIVHSDGTLLITRGDKTPETRYAVETALRHQRQLLHVDLSQHTAFEASSLTSSWISLQQIREVFITACTRRPAHPSFWNPQQIPSIYHRPWKRPWIVSNRSCR